MFRLIIAKYEFSVRNCYETINSGHKIYYLADQISETKTNGWVMYHNNSD